MPRAHRNYGHPRDQVVAADGRDTVKTCRVASDRDSRRSPIWLPRDTVAELDAARPLPGALGGITARRSDRLNYACSNAGGLRISIPRFEPQAAARDRAVIGMLAACWAPYATWVQTAAERDPAVAERLLRVAALQDPATRLFRPRTALRVLLGNLRRRRVATLRTSAALAAGGRDNGAPGRSFVYDRDGNNMEAVCHRPASED